MIGNWNWELGNGKWELGIECSEKLLNFAQVGYDFC